MNQLTLAVLAVGLPLAAGDGFANHKDAVAFDTLEMHLEVNATDGDAEIVFLAKTDEGGLAHFSIRNPLGDKIFRSRSRDAEDVGIREYALETAEPNIDAVLVAYPEGTYAFSGRLFDGTRVRGNATLVHALPSAVVDFIPNGDVIDASEALAVTWTDVGASSYIVEIENDDEGLNVTATLPAGTAAFVIGPGTLSPGSEYEISVSSVNEHGNIVVIEGDFETLEQTE